MPADPRRRGQLLSLGQGAGEILAAVDVVFPVLHGPYGEDGTIQGLLELAGVPYVGAGVLASAAGWTRSSPRSCWSPKACRSATTSCCGRIRHTVELEDRERLGLPVFVKPARGGSSIGVSRVSAWDQLPAAIADARRHDPKVIVEAAVPGRELECGVLEFPDGRVEASTVGEIRVAGVRGREDAFYDFATKYLDDAAELDVPAKIDDDVSDEVRQLAIRAFHAIDCQGLARVDFFLTEDGPGDQRDQHDARVHHDLDVSEDVGRQRRGLSDAAGRHGRYGAGPRHRACVSAAGAGSISVAGNVFAISLGDLLNRRRPRPLRQRQRDVDRPVDG